MAQIYTHYDNLKVARNAPPEVIRAAYKTLSQKYHPDRNPGNSEATRIMAIINASYEVLSDPDKRRKHDLWIEQQERLTGQTSSPNSRSPREYEQTSSTQQPHARVNTGGVVMHIIRNSRLYGFAFVLIAMLVIANSNPTPPPSPKPYQAEPELVQTDYIRPNAAPNGSPWPISAGYIKGYKRLRASGLSSVTVDNSRNDSDVFVKLVTLNGKKAYPVRQFYIPALGTFTLKKVTKGRYDIRYRDLDSGSLFRTEAFILQEQSTYNGTKFSEITMTLYKVRNGNMHTYALSDSDF